MITVSKAIENRLITEYNFRNTQTIYNAVEKPECNQEIKLQNILNSNYILYYGRLVDSVKNISLLIRSYAISKLPELNIKLLILGDGDDKNKLIHLSRSLGLESHVIFKGYISNPFAYVKNAKFAVLTSKHEGFPMVIPEVLSFGVPFLSVNCKSGPSEVIQHKENGLLIENDNEYALADGMNTLVQNEKLYLHCCKKAKESIAHLSVKSIQDDWEKLLDSL